MLGTISRWLSRKAPRATARYVLPTDDPELTPIMVADESAELAAADVVDVQAPIAPAMPELSQCFADLSVQVRMLGQRVQAGAINHTRLLQALEALPDALRAALPDHAGTAQSIAALRDALADSAANNARLCEAIKPLAGVGQAAGAQLDAVKQIARHQRRQLRHQVAAMRAGRQALETQQRHYAELETSQQARLGAIQHETAQGFFKLERQLRHGARMQLAATCVALLLALGAFGMAAGLPQPSPPKPVPQAESDRPIPEGTVVEKSARPDDATAK